MKSEKVKNPAHLRVRNFLEAPPGIGPGVKVLQTSALPLGYGAVFNLGMGKGNPSPFRKGKRARYFVPVYGADYGARTRHLHLGKVALYQMS